MIHASTDPKATTAIGVPSIPARKCEPLLWVIFDATHSHPSGTPIQRPHGQAKAPDAAEPTFGPSRRLDFELELGFVIGEPSELGRPVRVEQALDHVAGVVLVNDWSARDIQAWEYQPLGPFLGKSFATSVSHWVVPLDELAESRVPREPQEPEPLEYLREEPWAFDIPLEASAAA